MRRREGLARSLFEGDGVLGRSIIIWAAAVTTTLVGCARPHPGDVRFPLAASPHPFHPDVPLPQGFRLVHRNDGGRPHGNGVVRQRYTGRSNVAALRRFYRRQMPLVRWVAVDERTDRRHIVMRFARDNQRLEIAIHDRGLGLFSTADVEVEIRTSSANPEREQGTARTGL